MLKDIEYNYTIHSNIYKVWHAWTSENELKNFFGKEYKIEWRIGGNFEVYFLLEAPIGFKGSEGSKIIDIIPFQKLSFTWGFPPVFQDLRTLGNHQVVNIYFEKIEENITRLNLFHSNWPQDEIYLKGNEYFKEAWKFVLDECKNYLESN